MEVYETQLMPKHKAVEFARNFDSLIGTERELNIVDEEAYVICFELTYGELQICVALESKMEELS